MITWKNILVETERRRDKRARAEKERFIRQVVLRRNSPPTRSYQRWLAHLGAQLVTWGCRLQARYDHTMAISSTVRQERCVAEGNARACTG